jgi:hypothetical protein
VKGRELGGGYLTKNGVAQSENTLFGNQPISQFAQWAFAAGSAGSTSTIGFNAIDSRGAFNPSVVSTVNVAVAATTDTVRGGHQYFCDAERRHHHQRDNRGFRSDRRCF